MVKKKGCGLALNVRY